MLTLQTSFVRKQCCSFSICPEVKRSPSWLRGRKMVSRCIRFSRISYVCLCSFITWLFLTPRSPPSYRRQYLKALLSNLMCISSTSDALLGLLQFSWGTLVGSSPLVYRTTGLEYLTLIGHSLHSVIKCLLQSNICFSHSCTSISCLLYHSVALFF